MHRGAEDQSLAYLVNPRNSDVIMAIAVLEVCVSDDDENIITLPGGFLTVLRKLNVGCGFDLREGYVNVDMNDFHQPDVVANIIDLEGFPDNAFEEVLAKDVLEHFSWRLTSVALRSWNRVLAPEGRLNLVTTYLPGLALRVFSPAYMTCLRTQHTTLINMFSSQSYEGDFHYTAFTERQIRYHAHAAGFAVTNVELRDGWLIDVEMIKLEHRTNLPIQEGNDADFVHLLYQEVLGREAEQEGLLTWLERLEDGWTREKVLEQFLGSEERQNIDLRSMEQFDPGPLILGI